MRHSVDQRLHYITGPTVYQAIKPSAAASNWWEIDGETCVAAYQAKGAASLAASYVNLANPGTYDLTVTGTAPSFSAATGWTFAGLGVLDTGYQPAAITNSYAVRITSHTGGRYVFGSYTNDNALVGIDPVFTNGTGSVWANGKFVARSTGGPYTSATLAIANLSCYVDGSVEATGIPSGGSATTQTITLGNMKNLAVTNFSGVMVAFAIYSTTLDATQVATLSAAMAAL